MSTTRTVTVADLEQYIGRWISFESSDGWDTYFDSGYLLGIEWATPDNHYNYVVTGENPDDAMADWGGTGLALTDVVHVHVLPPAYALNRSQN